jgi:Big-like domain-containing protein/IPT/TIG domain-containing protein
MLGTFSLALLAQAAQAGQSGKARPTITNFSPTSGPPGTNVTLSGANLKGGRAVAFNGMKASYVVNSNSQITAVVPTGATSGPITVTTNTGTASSASVFQTQPAADTVGPSVALVAPTNFAVVSGNVGVSASATDNVGVSRVELYRNGGLFATLTTAPYTYTWDSSGTANGSYTLTATAYDAAGNAGSSNPLTVTVHNYGVSTGVFVAPTGSDTSGDGSISRPFATLAKAQATMRLGGPQITYLRGGYYALPAVTENGVSYGLHLTPADSGQTWSYYPPDGYGSAILDGGSTSASTGIKELITIDGASHVTINGLQLQHFRWIGIGLHGGGAFFELFPTGTAMADGNTIMNNTIHDGSYDTSPVTGYGGGAVYSEGNIPHTTVTNNVVSDISTWGIEAEVGDAHTGGDVSSLRIVNNVVLSTCLLITDCGAIYVQDKDTTSTGIHIENNFARDSGSPTAPARSIYLDDGVSGAIVSDNISAGNFAWAFTIHGGANNTISSNIVDLGQSNRAILLYQADGLTGMTGNTLQGNVIVAGGAGGWYEGAYWGFGAQPTIKNNLYHQYAAGGAIYTDGWNGLNGDASPVFADPQLACWTYDLTGGSPVYSAPVSFVSLPRNWGPPGYNIPATGTPPSQPHSC